MSNSILVTKTPKSCSECPVRATFIPNFWEGCEYQFDPLSLSLVEARKQRHPQCPLQDTTELLEFIKIRKWWLSQTIEWRTTVINEYNKALGGKDG